MSGRYGSGFGVNKTGRSTGTPIASHKKHFGPPKGKDWVWLTAELVRSLAWRAQSINCRRLIEFLIIEHRAHAGQENGALLAPYDQLVDWGLTRSEIRRATEEAEALGLCRCERGGMWAGTNMPSRYRLTFYATPDGNGATNEWRQIGAEEILAWRDEKGRRHCKTRNKRPARKNRSRVRLSELG